MANPVNRATFKDYCLRRLGFPVIEINVDDDQVEDRINDALQYYQDYHFDAVEKIYIKHVITQEDIDNMYLPISPLVTGITRIFPLSDSQATTNMFDLRYQLRLHELYDFTSASYVNYTLTMQHLRTLELLFTGEIPIRFQRHQNRLYVDWAWGTDGKIGQIVIAEGYSIIDPDTYTEVWNDRWLKEYATLLIKRQWGENLKKFAGVQLPGGVTLNGDKIFQEASAEIERLEREMETNFSLPVEWIMG